MSVTITKVSPAPKVIPVKSKDFEAVGEPFEYMWTIYPVRSNAASVGLYNSIALLFDEPSTYSEMKRSGVELDMTTFSTASALAMRNLNSLDQYAPATTSIMSPASSSVGNPSGSPVLESQRIKNVAEPFVTSISKLP